MKKSFALALIALLAFSATFAITFVTQAENSVVTAKVLNNNQTTLHRVFNSPTDIFAYEDTVVIKTADGANYYSNGEITLDEQFASSDIAYLDGVAKLIDGNIVYGQNTLLGSYTAISSYQNILFALEGNVIYKLELVGGVFGEKQEYISVDRKVSNIAATDSGIAYSVTANDGYTNLIYVNHDLLATVDEEIIDLDFNGGVYALTASKIVLYSDKYTYTTFDIISAKKIAVSDKVYVLTRTNSVHCVSLDLSSSFTLIAAGGEIDWFYSCPTNGTTRLNKIFVADKTLNRVAVIDGTEISYITGFNQPVAVECDNSGNVYVAHYGNRIARFCDGELIDETTLSENVIDLKVDYDGNVYALTANHNVFLCDGELVKADVTAFEFQNGLHYMSQGYLDEIAVSGTDFCMDAKGSYFVANGNQITSIINGESSTITVQNVINIDAIAISKLQSDLIGYGDLLLFDSASKCVFVVAGSEVGSADVSALYPIPDIDDEALDLSEGVVATTKAQTYVFTRPLEGEVSYVASANQQVLVCSDISSPEPFVFCLIEDAEGNFLAKGYVYSPSISQLSYSTPTHTEAKINTDNTPIYKYPSLKTPTVSVKEKGSMITILPFVTNYTDSYGEGWYCDAFGNKWYRISLGDKEGYVLVADTNVNFFSNIEMPQTNATIIENAVLYRYDEETDSYVQFEAAGLYISKDTRVMVEIPFDTSREYTKIVFFREGYGTIDAGCYVRTEYISFDGVDLVKIIALVAVAVAILTLVLVIIYKRRTNDKPLRRR